MRVNSGWSLNIANILLESRIPMWIMNEEALATETIMNKSYGIYVFCDAFNLLSGVMPEKVFK